MNDALDPRDDLTDRLSALGRQPVGSALQSEHLTAMAGQVRGASWRSALGSRVKIGAAVLGGFLIGTTGLATAGVLGPMQSIAKTTVEAVTPLEVPDSAADEAKDKSEEAKDKADEAKDKAEEAAGETENEAKEPKNWADPECSLSTNHSNRGQFLKDVRENKTAAEFKAAQKSDCGKSMSAVDAEDHAKVEDETDKPESGKPETEDHGKSNDKREDGDHKSDRSGKGGGTEAPESTPVVPAPSTERHDAPEAGVTEAPETEHSGSTTSGSGTSGSGTSGSGSDDSGHSGSGR